MSSSLVVTIEEDDPRREFIFGTKAIAHALGVSVRSFHRLNKKRPIPLYENHRGIFARRSELMVWVNQGTAPHRIMQAANGRSRDAA